jgi:hypothetical protein
MYHPPSRRKQLIQRTVTYGFMTLAVVTLVAFLVFIMLGYQFNQSDGRIEQGGLVQFDTQPDGATVTVDGRKMTTRTPSKLTASAGQHFVTMSRSGYDTWQKAVTVVPGSVLWLNYARLVPTKLTPVSVADFPIVSGANASPNMKVMAVLQAVDTPDITLADITHDTVTTRKLTLPDGSYTVPADSQSQRFSLVRWDPDSRYLLVKHTYDTTRHEWIVVDTRDASRTKNITKLLDVDASDVVFDTNNSHILYAKVGNDVRKVDSDAATLSRPLVRNVAEFSVLDDSTLLYVTLRDPATKKRSIGSYHPGAEKPSPFRSYNDDGKTPLHLAAGKYFGDSFEAVSYGDTVEVLRGDLPKTVAAAKSLRHVAKFTVQGGVRHLSIVTEGRFVIAQNNSAYTTYDLELKKKTTTTPKGTGDIRAALQWLDDYTLWSDRDGKLRLYEFDGANQHAIMKVTQGLAVSLSPNGKYVYAFSKDKAGTYHLQRVQLIL